MRIFDKLKNHLISPNIKDMIVLILSRGSSFVLSYLNLILITKLLNVDLFGEYKFYLHVLSFTSIFFEFGIFTSGSRLIGQTNSEEEKKEYLSCLFILFLIQCVLFSFVVVFIAFVSDSFFNIDIKDYLIHFSLLSSCSIAPYMTEQLV